MENRDYDLVSKSEDMDEGVKKANRVDLAAKLIFALEIGFSILYAFYLWIVPEDGFAGFCVLIIGPVIAWIAYEFLSGFAMLIKKVSLAELNTRKVK